MKIYTKTGDGGKTSLIGGTKIHKSHLRIESYGTVDELNSHIGVCRDLLLQTNPSITNGSYTISQGIETLKEIQDRLFTIGSSLACDPVKEPGMKMPDLLETDVTRLEQEMDSMNEMLPPMKFFVLPGGHIAVSQLHVARTVCRRAERCCVRMDHEELFIDQLVIKYINRLSDYLFVLSRFTGHVMHISEIPWKPRVHK
jgi:cob(I)alamin adenosyltransferase